MTETPERPETALEREARSLDDYANEVESEMTEAVLRGAAKRLRALASSLGEPVSQEVPWVVWSHERSAWWRASHHGYCGELLGAGIYTEAAARHIEEHARSHIPGERPPEVAMSMADAIAKVAAGVRGDTVISRFAASRSAFSGIPRTENEPGEGVVRCAECARWHSGVNNADVKTNLCEDCASVISSASPLSEEEVALVEEWRQALSFWPHADPAIQGPTARCCTTRSAMPRMSSAAHSSTRSPRAATTSRRCASRSRNPRSPEMTPVTTPKTTKGPSLNPQRITKRSKNDLGPGVHAWYYESKRGIELIVQTRDARGRLIAEGSPVIRIPWGTLVRSAKRCGKVADVR